MQSRKTKASAFERLVTVDSRQRDAKCEKQKQQGSRPALSR